MILITRTFIKVIILWSALSLTALKAEPSPENTNQDTLIDYLIKNKDIYLNLKKLVKEIKKTEQSLSLLWNDTYIQSILVNGPFCSNTLSPHTWFFQKIMGSDAWLKIIDKNSTTLGIYDMCQSFLSAIACTNSLFAYTHWITSNPLTIASVFNSLYALPIVTFFTYTMPQKLFIEPINKIKVYKNIVDDFSHFLHTTQKLKAYIQDDALLREIAQPFDMLDYEAWISQKIEIYKKKQKNLNPKLLEQSNVDINLLNTITHRLIRLENDIKTFKQYANTMPHHDTLQQQSNWIKKTLYSAHVRFCSYNTCSAFKILLDIKGHFTQLIEFVKTVDEYLTHAHQIQTNDTQ